MNNRRQVMLMLGAVGTCLALPQAPLRACGLDGGLGNAFSAVSPRSIDVAIAIREATEAGVLAPLASPDGGSAAERAHDLAAAVDRVAGSSATAPPAFNLFLVDSGLWTRLTPGSGAALITIDEINVLPDGAIVVTGEAVVAAIMERRVTADDVYHRKLVAVDGADRSKEQVAQVVAMAF